MKLVVIVRAFNDESGRAYGFTYIGKTSDEAIHKFVSTIWDWWCGFVDYSEDKTEMEIMNIYKEMYEDEENITMEEVDI